MPIAHTFAGASLRNYGLFKKTAIAAEVDAYFKNTVLLLPGNGTNGAQNNTFLDSSTNAFSITRNGNTTQGTFSPFSQTGWSNYFDGSGDWLTVADNAALDLGSGALTIEFWVNPSRLGQAQTIVSNWQGVSNGYTVGITSGNVIRVNLSGDGVDITGSVTLSVGQWYHVAVSGASNSYKLFVNGTQDGSTYTGTPSADGSTLFIGADPYLGGSEELQGYISNFRIVKGTSVYSSNFTPPTAALTAITNTSLLTCQSNRFVDNSTNAFTITRVGNTSVQAFSPFAPTAAYDAATNGGSGYFDGTGDYLSGTTALVTQNQTTFSVECWVYLPVYTTGSRGNVIGLDTLAGGDYLNFGVNSSGNIILWWYDGAIKTATSTGTVKLNEWAHIAVKVDSNAITFYLNGVSGGTGTLTNRAGTIGGFYVGSEYNNYEFKGYMSGLRVTNTAITPTLPTSPPTAVTGTKLLLNFTNAGITDATAKNDLETVGNAQISNAQAKWGSTSISLSASGNTLQTKASNQDLNVGSGDFTVEGWVYFSSTPSTNGVFQMSNTAGGFAANQTNNLGLATASSSTWQIYAKGTYTTSSSTTITVGSWIHFALVRNGTTTVLYINGSSLITVTSDSTTYNTPYIGLGAIYDSTSYPLAGYIQDLRITKGIARYTANFTAPTKAFALQ